MIYLYLFIYSVAETVEHHPEDNLLPTLEQPVGLNSRRKSPRTNVKTNTTSTDDAEGLLNKRPSDMVTGFRDLITLLHLS